MPRPWFSKITLLAANLALLSACYSDDTTPNPAGAGGDSAGGAAGGAVAGAGGAVAGAGGAAGSSGTTAGHGGSRAGSGGVIGQGGAGAGGSKAGGGGTAGSGQAGGAGKGGVVAGGAGQGGAGAGGAAGPGTNPAEVAGPADARCSMNSPVVVDPAACMSGPGANCGGLTMSNPVCGSCLTSQCCTELAACASNQDYTELNQCLMNCPDNNCAQQCTVSHPVGYKTYSSLYYCQQKKCAQDCNQNQPPPPACQGLGGTGDPTCDTCFHSKCCTEIDACANSLDCTNVLVCFGTCDTGDAICRHQCELDNAAGFKIYTGLIGCLQNTCTQECPLFSGQGGGAGAGGDAGAAGSGAGGDCQNTDIRYDNTLYGSSGKDDNCKYSVTWSSSGAIIKDQGVMLSLTVKSLADGKLVTGAMPRAEIFFPCDLAHAPPAIDLNAMTTETSPGHYTIGPVQFDQSGHWAVRFHLFESCDDGPKSPHGQVAFYVDVP